MNVTGIDFTDDAPWPARTLFSLLTRLECGRLTITGPDRIRRTFEGPREGAHAELVLRDWKAIGVMTRRAEIGLYECWRDGLVSTPDMVAVLRVCAANHAVLEGVFYGKPLVALALRVAHAMRPNTRAGARKNIHAHYDLGNAFYALWLDAGMTYSSGIFAPGRTLAQSQDAKYDRMLDVLEVDSSHRVLEVGCGWGAFAERAAATRGCHVTGLTISQAQLDYGRERIVRAGLQERVDLRFCDYRDSEGQFDRIVSVEMVEAVGERYWPNYFRTLHDRLKPGGRAVVQSIVIAERAFERYSKSSDFIREYIFPGGMLPSVPRFIAAARKAGLEAKTPFLFGRDYAETLRRWRTAFNAQESNIRALGFDNDFLAAWRFYFDYCEAGFDSGRCDVMQIELVRP